jgi:hypothetical protein|tara:strand:+ start:1354 stop:2025 length:672 start_codon:yes stop_codon:yes gene_type:complete
MSINDAYLKFLQKVNKNRINDNIVVDKDRFIYTFKEAENKFIEKSLDKRNEDDIRMIQEILTPDFSLKSSRTTDKFQEFELPKNYFDFTNLRGLASTDKCKSKELVLNEVKGEDVHLAIDDKFSKPSFKYRESFYTISNNHIQIYVDDFTIDKALLTYYRYPVSVDMAGYVDTLGNPSVGDIDPNWSDRVLDRILDIAAKEFNLNTDNIQRYQADKDRINNNF